MYDSILMDAIDKCPEYIYMVFNVEPLSKSNHLMRGPNNIMYIPKKFKDWDREVKRQAIAQMTAQKRDILDKPIIMHIDGYYPTKRVVDAPNLSKSICDALNDIVYYDDRQIVSCITTKSYDKLNPRVEILITILDGEHSLVNVSSLIKKGLSQ